MTRDKIIGALLGTAVGDALGMPIEGLSHQNVRTYYKGIKEYRADDQRGDLDAGQWTDDTQFTFAVARALVASDVVDEWPEQAAHEYVALMDEARRWGPTTQAAVDRLAEGLSLENAGDDERPTDGAAMRAAPLGAWWAATGASRDDALPVIQSVLAVTHRHPAALAAGVGQAFAVRTVLDQTVDAFEQDHFWSELITTTEWAESELGGGDESVSTRLHQLAGHLDEFPLDLRDLCSGVGVRANEAWPFAVAMFARAPHLVENTLLSAINVGGDADTTGAMLGALLGGLHGWKAFPDEWHDGLEACSDLEAQAEAFAQRLTESL
jgi:ADP-ribosylglycohydrolase